MSYEKDHDKAIEKLLAFTTSYLPREVDFSEINGQTQLQKAREAFQVQSMEHMAMARLSQQDLTV